MNTKLIALLLATTCAGFAAPVLASNDGPAPFYRPSLDAPAAERGQFGDIEAASGTRRGRDAVDAERANMSSGGTADSVSQSGASVAIAERNGLFAHH